MGRIEVMKGEVAVFFSKGVDCYGNEPGLLPGLTVGFPPGTYPLNNITVDIS